MIQNSAASTPGRHDEVITGMRVCPPLCGAGEAAAGSLPLLDGFGDGGWCGGVPPEQPAITATVTAVAAAATARQLGTVHDMAGLPEWRGLWLVPLQAGQRDRQRRCERGWRQHPAVRGWEHR
jgi:hypothetical protein